MMNVTCIKNSISVMARIDKHLTFVKLFFIVFALMGTSYTAICGAHEPIERAYSSRPMAQGSTALKVVSFLSDKGVSAASPILPYLMNKQESLYIQGLLHIIGTLGGGGSALYIHRDQWKHAWKHGHYLKFTEYFIIPILITILHATSTFVSFYLAVNLENQSLDLLQKVSTHLPGGFHILNQGLSHFN